MQWASFFPLTITQPQRKRELDNKLGSIGQMNLKYLQLPFPWKKSLEKKPLNTTGKIYIYIYMYIHNAENKVFTLRCLGKWDEINYNCAQEGYLQCLSHPTGVPQSNLLVWVCLTSSTLLDIWHMHLQKISLCIKPGMSYSTVRAGRKGRVKEIGISSPQH